MHLTGTHPYLRPIYRALREGAAHFQAGRYQAALERFEHCLGLCAGANRSDALRQAALFYQGKCLHHMRRYPDAVRSYRQALLLGGDQFGVWFWKAQAERSAGRHADAARSLHRFLELATEGNPVRLREAREWLAEWGYPDPGRPARRSRTS